jgi:hypothetical protein
LSQHEEHTQNRLCPRHVSSDGRHALRRRRMISHKIEKINILFPSLSMISHKIEKNVFSLYHMSFSSNIIFYKNLINFIIANNDNKKIISLIFIVISISNVEGYEKA